MNGIAELGLSYKEKEVDVKGYSRFYFSAQKINSHSVGSKTYTLYFEEYPYIYLAKSNQKFNVDCVDLYINGCLIGRCCIPVSLLSCHSGKIRLPKSFDIKKERYKL